MTSPLTKDNRHKGRNGEDIIRANRDYKNMLLTEYNEQETMELFRQDGIREGILKGEAKGEAKGVAKGEAKGYQSCMENFTKGLYEEGIDPVVIDRLQRNAENVLKELIERISADLP